MSEKKRVACFFTAGYTELNAMKSFMRKINDGVEYIQLCPIGPRKSKGAIKDRHKHQILKEQNGMTGEKLIDFAAEFIGKKRFEEEGYEAILIEDDKDGRFLSMQEDGTGIIDEDSWKCFKNRVIERLNKIRPDIPVIFFYAAPEIEAWFLADWSNGFGNVYKDVCTVRQNEYFSIKFRKYVNDSILTDTYRNCIERYGYFEEKYRKLSAEIQRALQEIDFLEDYMPEKEHPTISYSKDKQGGTMLECVNPKTILQNCSFFFKDGYQSLQTL